VIESKGSTFVVVALSYRTPDHADFINKSESDMPFGSGSKIAVGEFPRVTHREIAFKDIGKDDRCKIQCLRR